MKRPDTSIYVLSKTQWRDVFHWVEHLESELEKMKSQIPDIPTEQDPRIYIDVRGFDVDKKKRVQDAFFKLGYSWLDVGYNYLDKEFYSNGNANDMYYSLYLEDEEKPYLHTYEQLMQRAYNDAGHPDEPKRKTVEDAVEHYGGVWPDDSHAVVRAELSFDTFFTVDYFRNEKIKWETSYQVCTREEFEDYLKENSVEEKQYQWRDGQTCTIALEPDADGKSVVRTSDGKYHLVDAGELVAVDDKPVISKAEACRMLFERQNLSYSILADDYLIAD